MCILVLDSGGVVWPLARCALMDSTYFYVTRIPTSISLLYIETPRRKKNSSGTPRRLFNQVRLEMET